MEQKITLVYNPIERTVEIAENEFSALEAFGILEAAKLMIANNWLGNDA